MSSFQPRQSPVPTSQVEIALSVSTSPTSLVRAACQLQFEKNEAHSLAQDLRQKLADVANQLDESDVEATTTAPKSKRQRVDDEDAEISVADETKVTNASHLFVILYGPWLRHGDQTFLVDYNPERNELERFENNDNKIQGQLREIVEVLGPQLSQRMQNELWIAKVFMRGMKSQHSNTATRLRRYCAGLFGVSESDMLRAEVRREKFCRRIGWVNNGHGLSEYSSVNVEILHKDYTGQYDITKAFLNPILMLVFVAIICGPTAAKEMMHGALSIPRTETMARKHGIRTITPGAIACSAILAHWALSADDYLQNVGTNTGINYLHDFEEYLELLSKGLHRKKKSVLNVFRIWNRIVFPGSDSDYVAGISRGLKTAMTMLDADETKDKLDEAHTT